MEQYSGGWNPQQGANQNGNQPIYPCSSCGWTLVWVHAYQAWWCDRCRKYEGYPTGVDQQQPQQLQYQPAPQTQQQQYPSPQPAPQAQQPQYDPSLQTLPAYQQPAQGTLQQCQGEPCANPGDTNVQGLSAIGYQGPRIIYKVKVSNPGPEPICDVKVTIFLPGNAFLVDGQQKTISLLQPGESNTVTFYLRPTGECGKRTLNSEVDFYDYGTGCRKRVGATARDVEVVCPILSPISITEQEWKEISSRLITSQDETGDIPLGAENLSKIIGEAVREFNMTLVGETRVAQDAITNIVQRFYGQGVKGLQYCARIEVMGGVRNAKVLLTCHSENDAALTGFHHALVDMIEKRTQVKQYLTDNIVIQNVKGDVVSGSKVCISDSVINRSNIG